MSDIKCPYCGELNDHDFEQGEPDFSHQTECEHCEKTFVFSVSWYPSFSSYKADCLNGAEHVYKDVLESNDYYRQYLSKWLRCGDCGHEVKEPKK